MSSFAAFLRIIKFSWQDFWRNIWLSIVTVSILFLAIFSIDVLLVFNYLTNQALSVVENRIDIGVYFRPEVKESITGKIRDDLLRLPEVDDVAYISPEDALARFRKEHADDLIILESLDELGENPLGPALIVKAKDPNQYALIIQFLDQPDIGNVIQNRDFRDYAETIQNMTFITERIRRAGLFLSGLFALLSLLVVFNTIRIAIYTYRDEIGIMKLVGATNFFIRAPFFFLVFAYTIVSILLATAVFVPFLYLLDPYIQSFFAGTPVDFLGYFRHNAILFSLFELFGFLLVNVVASTIAIRKYLRV